MGDGLSTGGGRTAVSVPAPGIPGLTVSNVPTCGAGGLDASPGIETTVVIVDEVYPTLVEMTVQGT